MQDACDYRIVTGIYMATDSAVLQAFVAHLETSLLISLHGKFVYITVCS